MPNVNDFKTHKDYLQWYRDYRKNNPRLREYNRNYNREWRKKNSYHNEINSKKRYPEKEYARYLIQYAVRKGKIKRLPCEICKKPKAQAHHPNYSKPLEIIWLCPLHHRMYHSKAIHRKLFVVKYTSGNMNILKNNYKTCMKKKTKSAVTTPKQSKSKTIKVSEKVWMKLRRMSLFSRMTLSEIIDSLL